MKAKFLLAMALPIALAACTNDDELLNNAPSEVTGEKIASGMILKADRTISDATTRLNDSGWEVGDYIGLARMSSTTTEQAIQANMQFVYGDNDFTTDDDVFKGDYFAYYPFTRLGDVKQMTISLNGKTQEEADAEQAFFDGVFSISTKDKIDEDDVNADGQVEKQFVTQNVANALVVKTTMGDKASYTDEQIANMKITGVTLNVGRDVLADVIMINPQNLPPSVYNQTTKAFDAAASLEAIDTPAKVIGTGKAVEVDGSRVSSISVAVDNGATLATENDGFVLFSLPIENDVDLTASSVNVVIRTIAGEVTIDYTKDAIAGSVAAANNAAIEKLVALFSKDGYTANGKTYNFSKFLNARVGLDFQIDMDNFTAIYSDIQTAAEWNAAVDYANTFFPGQTLAFTITDDIEFTSDEPMTLPAAGLSAIEKSASEAITFASGTHAIEKKIASCNVDMTIAKNATVTVAVASDNKPLLTLGKAVKVTNEGTLNVNGEIAGTSQGTAYADIANIVNKGTINVGVNGKINSQAADGFSIQVQNDTPGKVTVGYNSYVHFYRQVKPTGTVTGIIDGNDATAKTYYAYLINRMIAVDESDFAATSGTTDYPVTCNTIELRNITVTEGDEANVTTSGLPWASAGDYKIETTTFSGIDVILNNAALASETGTAMNYATIVANGTSALNGVFTGGDVTVEKNGTLSVGQYIKSTTRKATDGSVTMSSVDLTVEEGATLAVDQATISKPALENKGTITLTNDKASVIEATTIDNTGGLISMGEDARVTYSTAGGFTGTGGTVTGGNVTYDDGM